MTSIFIGGWEFLLPTQTAPALAPEDAPSVAGAGALTARGG